MTKSINERRAEINKTVPHGVEAVCFDLDGVLVDAAEWHKDALNEALVSFGLPPIGEEDHIKTYNGLSTYRKLEMFGVDPHLHLPIYKKKQEKTVEIINRTCVPIQRIVDVVAVARLIFDDRIAVVTNCSRDTAELMLRKSGLLHMFKFIVTNEDVDGDIKPHPRPYLLAQEKLGIKGHKSILAIDDTDRGIMSAVDAMCRTWYLKQFEHLTVENLAKVLNSYRITL